MKTIHKNRLLKLADFLEKLPEKRFEYKKWVGTDWKGRLDLKCGTTACAMGWGVSLFGRRSGVILLKIKDYAIADPVCLSDVEDYVMHNISTTTAWQNAAKALFGLTESQAIGLFMPSDNYERLGEQASAKDVAAMIREFVDGGYGV